VATIRTHIHLRTDANGTAVFVFITSRYRLLQGPQISLDQSVVAFATVQNTNPAPSTLNLQNSGTETLTWQAAATTNSEGNWLSVTPTSGSLAPTQRTPLFVAVNVQGLAPGTYSGRVTITAPGAGNSPQSATVQLQVGAFKDTLKISQCSVNGKETILTTTIDPGPNTVSCDVEYDIRTDPNGGAVALFAFDVTTSPFKELAAIFPVPVDPTTKVETLQGLELKFEVSSDSRRIQIRAVLIAATSVLATDQRHFGITGAAAYQVLPLAGGRPFADVLASGLTFKDQQSEPRHVLLLIYDDQDRNADYAEFYFRKQHADGTPAERSPLVLKGYFDLDNEAIQYISDVIVPDDTDQLIVGADVFEFVGGGTLARVEAKPAIFNVDRVRIIGNTTVKTELTRGVEAPLQYKLEYNTNFPTGTYEIKAFLNANTAGTVAGVPLVSAEVRGKGEVTFNFSVTPDDATRQIGVIFALYHTDQVGTVRVRGISDVRIYKNIQSPPISLPAGLTTAATALGVDLRPVQNSANRILKWSRLAKTGASAAKDFGQALNLLQNAPVDSLRVSNSLSADVLPLREFIGIYSSWRFDPPIPAAAPSDFTADLTLHYDRADFPDDPNFSEANLKVVSLDPATGNIETYPTTLDRTARTATARVIGLRALYTLGVVGPFSQRTLNFPLLKSSGDTYTGLGFLNLGTAAASLTLTAYDAKGQAITGDPIRNPVSRTLGAAQQLPDLVSKFFNITHTAGAGWVQTRADRGSVVGFQLVGDRDRLDGVDTLINRSPAVVLPDIEFSTTYTTEVHVANPNSVAINVSFELRSAPGAVVGTYETTLAGKGKIERTIQDLFPTLTRPFAGYLIVRGDADLVAAELLVSEQSMAALNGQILSTPAAVRTRLYSAQLATGGGSYATRLNLVNATPLPARLTVRGVSESGGSLGSTVSLTLAAGQQYQAEAGQAFGLNAGVLTVGSIIVESDISGIVGDVSFDDPSASNNFRSTLPLESEPSTFGAFAQVANGAGYFTGAAIFNPSGATANITIKIMRADGSLTGSTRFTLPPNGRTSKLLPQFVPASEGQVGGYFTIEADQPIVSFAQFGTTNLSALSAVPAQR
jgi:hypothetical protein